MADIIDTARSIEAPVDQKVPILGYQAGELSDTPILPIEDVETACYLRMTALDKAGVLAEVTDVFAKHNISIEAVSQKEPDDGAERVHIVMLTQSVKEKDMNTAIAEVENFEDIEGKVSRIRSEHLG